MSDAYLTMWTQRQLKIEREALQSGKMLDHTAGSQFRKRGVDIDDRVYVLATERGTGRLLLLGRMIVEQTVGQREAEQILGGPCAGRLRRRILRAHGQGGVVGLLLH